MTDAKAMGKASEVRWTRSASFPAGRIWAAVHLASQIPRSCTELCKMVVLGRVQRFIIVLVRGFVAIVPLLGRDTWPLGVSFAGLWMCVMCTVAGLGAELRAENVTPAVHVVHKAPDGTGGVEDEYRTTKGGTPWWYVATRAGGALWHMDDDDSLPPWIMQIEKAERVRNESASPLDAYTQPPWERERDESEVIVDGSALQAPWDDAIDTGHRSTGNSYSSVVPPWVLQSEAVPPTAFLPGQDADQNWDSSGANSDDSASDLFTEPGTARPQHAATCMCDTCGCLFSGSVCKCATLAVQHPVTKILSRARAARSSSQEMSPAGAGVFSGGAGRANGAVDEACRDGRCGAGAVAGREHEHEETLHV